jgi:hypothetical protein
MQKSNNITYKKLLMEEIISVVPEYFVNFKLTLDDNNYLFEIIKMDWRFMEDILSEIIGHLCDIKEQINYVDENGTNILMAYCIYTDGLEPINTNDDIKTIINSFDKSINDTDKDGNTALMLSYNNKGKKTHNITEVLLNYLSN